MTYHVEFSVRALHDLDVLYFENNVEESLASSPWFNGLQDAVYSLELLPNRGPIAPEAKNAGRRMRHLLCGKKPHFYRIIYEVDESLRMVKVFHIRHGARRPLKPFEIS
jgi:mRNA-degrading endonuclease RelE of RelBE toxin-antitoxin system